MKLTTIPALTVDVKAWSEFAASLIDREAAAERLRALGFEQNDYKPMEFTRFRAPRSDRKRSPLTRERDLQKYAARQAKAGR